MGRFLRHVAGVLAWLMVAGGILWASVGFLAWTLRGRTAPNLEEGTDPGGVSRRPAWRAATF